MKFVIAIACTASMLCVIPNFAHADPGTVDFNSYSSVPVEKFFRYTPKSAARTISFSTPYEIKCVVSAPETTLTINQGIQCSGHIPGLDSARGSGPGEDACLIGSVYPRGPQYEISKQGFGCNWSYEHGEMLNVGEKVAFQNATCAVGVEPLLACTDTTSGPHGFVLQASGSYAF